MELPIKEIKIILVPLTQQSTHSSFTIMSIVPSVIKKKLLPLNIISLKCNSIGQKQYFTIYKLCCYIVRLLNYISILNYFHQKKFLIFFPCAVEGTHKSRASRARQCGRESGWHGYDTESLCRALIAAQDPRNFMVNRKLGF